MDKDKLLSVDRAVLKSYLESLLSSITLEDFVGLITNEQFEAIEYIRLSHGAVAGQKTSLLFNPHRLSIKTKSSKLSIFDATRTDSFLDGMARALLFKKDKVREVLYQCIQLGVNGIQYVNEFPPHVARDLCLEHGNLTENSIVLDPCSGWGGRMLGVSTVCNYYVGYEPCLKTNHGLMRLAEFIKKFRPEFESVVFPEPFEEANLPEESVDFAITSPPYYDTEEYSDEPTNSLNRYSSFDEWTELFYLPMIEKTLTFLKPNCSFLLNIGSRKYPLNNLLKENFSRKYEIECVKSKLSGKGGLGKHHSGAEGEAFYKIIK